VPIRKRLFFSFTIRVVTAAITAIAALCCSGGSAVLPPQPPDPALVSALSADLTDYLAQRSTVEHISAASLSVSLPGATTNIDVTAGSAQYGGSSPVTKASVFQVGSNTKAFTAAVILQLEAEGKLTIDQTVGHWLPQYPTWRNVTIKRLLDMTSGIATYDDTQAWQQSYSSAPTADVSPAQLVAFVDPKAPLAPGWTYSNTNYQLAAMIVERVTGLDYASEVYQRIITRLGLHNTYYYPSVAPTSITSRMVSGYFYSKNPSNAGLAALYGRDMRTLSLSWAGAAGGVISTPEDLTIFLRALYQGALLAPTQRRELLSIVSDRTGMPIDSTSSDDPVGFGLGVGQITSPLVDGTVWYYEGETLGYRMTYAYFLQANVVFAVGLNSQPTSSDDNIRFLVHAIYLSLRSAGKL